MNYRSRDPNEYIARAIELLEENEGLKEVLTFLLSEIDHLQSKVQNLEEEVFKKGNE